jgi:hypothetical protein
MVVVVTSAFWNISQTLIQIISLFVVLSAVLLWIQLFSLLFIFLTSLLSVVTRSLFFAIQEGRDNKNVHQALLRIFSA